MINYQTMLSFNTEHQYFDFNAVPVQVLPTAETNKILNHCGFLFQKLETGCRILKQAGNASKQIMDARAIRTDVSEIMLMVDPDSVLEFWISTDDPEFHLYTDCSPEEKEEASISLQVDSDDKTNENCYRYNRHLQADDKTQNSGGNHSGKTSITPVFHYQQKSEFNPKFKADIWESGFDTKYKPLFVFRIPLRELVHRKSAINITARFLSRRVLWRYNIIADDQLSSNVEILDQENQVTFSKVKPVDYLLINQKAANDEFSKKSIQFISNAQIPLNHRERYQFVLRGDVQRGGRNLMFKQILPQASTKGLTLPPDANSDLVSDIYVNL